MIMLLHGKALLFTVMVLLVTSVFSLGTVHGLNPAVHEALDSVKLYQNPTGYYPGSIGIAMDQKGVVWFCDFDSLVKVTQNAAGTADYLAYKIPTAQNSTQVFSISFDSNGNVWFADIPSNTLWVFNPSTAKFSSYGLPTSGAYPMQMLLDQAGNLWFTERFGSKLGKFTISTQQFTEFSTPTATSGPSGLCMDSKGNLWIAEEFANQIAEFDPKTRDIPENTVLTARSMRPRDLRGQ